MYRFAQAGGWILVLVGEKFNMTMDHRNVSLYVWRQGGDALELEWDDSDEEAFEVLKWQIFSLTGSPVTVIDHSGCIVDSKIDIIDLVDQSDSRLRVAYLFAVENESDPTEVHLAYIRRLYGVH